MALTGSFNHYTWETSPTESSSIDISYPASLPADDEFYDLRGTTVTHWVSSSIATTHSYEGSYVFVQSAAIFNLITDAEGNNLSRLSYTARIYPSQDAKNEDILVSDGEWSYEIDWDWAIDTNPMTKAYNDIKNNNPGLTDI